MIPCEQAWLNSIRELSSTDLAKRLGITDRQARRIKTGKVGAARIREHAKRDHHQQKEIRRPRLRRVRAAFILRRAAIQRALHDDRRLNPFGHRMSNAPEFGNRKAFTRLINNQRPSRTETAR